MLLTHDSSDTAARFRILRRIGAGGMGEVFEAEDRQRAERVAIKTLPNLDAAAIYRLKQEFRALADVSHPNLIVLFELLGDGDSWCFTMELVDGVDFIAWVRPRAADGTAVDLPRLRSSFAQLVSAVHALHLAGKIHRDLKPSNVLVDRQGRVVVLDFGIAADFSARELQPTIETSIAGTAHYMAPEQAGEGTIGPSSDWYAVGVMMFEALTGRLPFEGNGIGVLVDKLTHDPPALDSVATGLPADLRDLCGRLLARASEDRPTEEEIVDIFATPESRATVRSGTAAPPSLVGRERQLTVLDDAFQSAMRGQASSVYVHGQSGMGKSTLVQHFLNAATRQPRVVVLTGRCYEREAVPYKALDGVIDSLARYLRTLSVEQAVALVPRDIGAAARLFPVLLRVEAIAHAPRGVPDTVDLAEARRRGVVALRELLARVADHAPLLVHIDDLQWADRDSLTLLDELRRPPDAPALLLIASFRTEEVDRKPFLRNLLDSCGQRDVREVLVDPLPDADARRLARIHLTPTAADEQLVAIVNEAGGSPLVIEQLAAYLRAASDRTTRGLRFGDVVETRLTDSGAGARAFMETLAVVAHPIQAAIAYRAAGLEGSELALVKQLELARLVRQAGEHGEVEAYHDRIREAVACSLDVQTVRSIHRSLCAALEARAVDDPEALYEHANGAGDADAAVRYALRAAERARDALAFDRAARFYRGALNLLHPNDTRHAALFAALGETLANAGRPADAAAAFDEAAQRSDPLAALEARRRAAEQLLVGGHGQRGMRALRALLADAGLPIPGGRRRALVGFLVQRARIALRGLHWTERPASAIAPMELLRCDLCWTCAQGLALIDYLLAANFQARHLRLALALGEPHRVARALNFEAGFLAASGGSRRKSDRVAVEGRMLAERLGSSYELGLAALIEGSIAFLRGEWRRAIGLCAHAEQVLREQCTGVLFELTTSQTFLLSSLLYAGDFAEVERRIPGLLDAAIERGDLLLATELRTRINLQWLVRDEPVEARRLVADALLQWANTAFTRQHFNAIAALTQLELYCGDAAAAWEQIDNEWGRIRRSTVIRVQVVRIGAHYLRARAALALAAAPAGVRQGSPERWQLFDVAERQIGELRREAVGWTEPLIAMIGATTAVLKQDVTQATLMLGDAAQGFDRAEMRAHASCARWRLGLLTTGDRGARLVEDAKAFLRGQGVRDPERFANVLAPWPKNSFSPDQ